MKDASIEHKDTSLISVLQGHFKRELNLARVKPIFLFITALCKIKTINYDRLASVFDVIKEFYFSINTVHALIFNMLQKIMIWY